MTASTASAEPILSTETAIAALNSEDNQIRYYAAWWLGKHQIQTAIEPLCLALKDERYRTAAGGYPLRRQAARALGQLKNPNAVPALLECLDCQEDIQLREAAIGALSAIKDKQVIPKLLELLKSPHEQPYEALIEALGSLEVWEAKSEIEPFLNYSSERVQCAAARYFYLLTKEAQYIERIVKNLSHENMYLRWAAAFDLGAIGHLEAVEAITKAGIANSLKLLNLKRILEAVSTSETEESKQEKITQILLKSMDDLMIKL